MNVVPFLVVHPLPAAFLRASFHRQNNSTSLAQINRNQPLKFTNLRATAAISYAHNGDSRRAYVTVNCSYPRSPGSKCAPITVEVHISKGLPGLTMVGLPETTVKEARDRVRSAIINSGYEYPAKKSPSTLLQPICQKKGDDMICLSLLRCWRPQNSLQPIS